MKNKKMRENMTGLLFVLPSFLIMVTVIIVPVITSVRLSFKNEVTGGYDFSNYISLFKDPNQVNNMKYTMYIVLVTVFLTIVISFVLSLFLRFSNTKTAAFLEKIYLLPRFIPGIVAVYTIILFIKDSGVMTRFMKTLFNVDFMPGLMYTRKGIITANLWFNISFATMMISSELSGIKDSVIEAAMDAGAGSLSILKNMILPLCERGIFITAAFVFMGNLGAFTTPFLMGTNAPRMMGIALQQEFSVFYNYPRAAAMSVVMFILSAAAKFSYIRTMLREDEWAK